MKDCIIPLFPLPSLMLYTFFTFLTQSEAIKMNNDLPGLCLFLSTNFELVVMNVLFSCHCSWFWTRPHLEVNLPSRRCSHPPRKHKTLLQSGSKSQRKFQHLITMEIEKLLFYERSIGSVFCQKLKLFAILLSSTEKYGHLLLFVTKKGFFF